MELKEFISRTLTEVADGVRQAIDKAEGRGYAVNPVFDQRNTALYNIKFELSVESEVRGGASIKVLSGGASEKSLNRVSFEVSMTYPSAAQHEKPTLPKV